MGGDTTLAGPDLAAGVRADALQPGEKLLGHARGEPVLLARIGDDFLAIGATCTHYGGPLADGIIDGDTVRCPWHHACFNLRTGEALRAPALSPVACFTVERIGDTIRVGDKVDRDALAPSYPLARSGAHPRSVVIVGAGAARNRTCLCCARSRTAAPSSRRRHVRSTRSSSGHRSSGSRWRRPFAREGWRCTSSRRSRCPSSACSAESLGSSSNRCTVTRASCFTWGTSRSGSRSPAWSSMTERGSRRIWS